MYINYNYVEKQIKENQTIGIYYNLRITNRYYRRDTRVQITLQNILLFNTLRL